MNRLDADFRRSDFGDRAEHRQPSCVTDPLFMGRMYRCLPGPLRVYPDEFAERPKRRLNSDSRCPLQSELAEMLVRTRCSLIAVHL